MKTKNNGLINIGFLFGLTFLGVFLIFNIAKGDYIPSIAQNLIKSNGLSYIYTDDLYGYKIQIPSDWHILKPPSNSLYGATVFTNYDTNSISEKTKNQLTNGIKIQISVAPLPTGQTFQDWFNKWIDYELNNETFKNLQLNYSDLHTVNLAGFEGYRFNIFGPFEDPVLETDLLLSPNQVMIIGVTLYGTNNNVSIDDILNTIVPNQNHNFPDDVLTISENWAKLSMPKLLSPKGVAGPLLGSCPTGSYSGSEAPQTPITLYMPFSNGETWEVGGMGYFYGNGDHCNSNNDYYGTDWNRPGGDASGRAVFPVADGTISSVTVPTCPSTDYGCFVQIDHSSGLRTLYGHLSAVYKTSGTVSHNDQIGAVGSTGHSTGPHLHLAFWQNNSGYFSYCWNNGSTCANGESPKSPQSPRPSPMQTTSGAQTLVDYGTYTSNNGSGINPISVSWSSPSNGQTVTTQTVHLQANPSGGTGGVNHVSFSAAWSGSWHGVQDVNSSPWGYDWNWCSAGVPNGDVELGLIAVDNGGNQYVYSEHNANYHITKNFTCPTGPSTPSNPNPGDGTTLERNNDTTMYWSTDGSTCDIHIWGGSIDINPSGGSCSSLHLGNQYGGFYQWQVTAHNSYGTTTGPAWHFYIKPYAPTALTATPVSQTSINLSWTLSSDDASNVDGYNIYRDGVAITGESKGVNSAALTGLTCGTPYSFFVTSIRQSVESNSSNVVNASTQSCIPPPSANFDAWPQSGTAPLTVSMHIVSTSNITTCSWDYGDSQLGTSCNSLHDHVYNNSGTFTVKLTVTGPGGTDSLTRTNYISVTAPVPTIASLSPTLAIAGGSTFTLMVNGTNFINGSVVRWNGSNRTTTYISATQLSATVPAADIATSGTVPVTVFNPAPGGGTSNAVNFTVNNPVPTLTTISPTSAIAGGTAFTLTVNGTYFVSSSVVRWNGNARTTTFVSATQLTAAITAADIATSGTIPVTVFNPTPGGGTSNAVNFTVNNPVPTLTTLSPTSAIARGSAFTLTVTGTNFVSSSVVRWNNVDRTTTYISTTQLSAAITSADIAMAGTIPVSVFNPTPGGGASNSVNFTVNNPVPTLTTLSPASATNGGPAFNMLVIGTNFVSSSVVRWNGNARTTTALSATELVASITAADIATVGTIPVTVFNPTPGGGTSGAVNFIVAPPTCFTLTTSISPISSGNINANPAPNCSGGKYSPGTVVQLTANPVSGYSFVNWTGALTGAVNPVNVTMDDDKNVIANFIANCDTCGVQNSAWPILRQNLLRTGRSPYNGPQNAVVKWSYPVGSFDGAAPAIGSDGTIYVGLGNDLYALTPSGTKIWNYTAGGAVQAPALSANGTIYAGSRDGKIYAINSNGTLKWSFTTGGWISASPAIGADGTLYIGSSDANLYAINYDGTLKWSYPVGSWLNSSPAIGSDGTIYFGSTTYSIYALNPNGTLKWSYQTGSYIDPTPAIGSDGTVYIGSVDQYFYALDASGNFKWKYLTGGAVGTPAALAVDGTIYFGSSDGKLYALQPNGTLKWSYLTQGSLSSVVLGADATVYAGSDDGHIYAINPNGSLKWSQPLSGLNNMGSAISSDGILYTVSYGTLFSLGDVPDPTITTLSPTSVIVGGTAFTLTVTGTNFVSGSVVNWNGIAKTTTYSSATQLTAAITAADIATAGTIPVTVVNPAPGGTSNAINFTVNNPVPTLTTLSPSSAMFGGTAFTLTVNGTNFVNSSVVRWNGILRTTTYVSATQLTAAITAADIATAGTVPITVFNPTPGGGTSNAVNFTVSSPPSPTITTLSPTLATAGGTAFTLTVNGTNFISSSVVRWNGSARTTTFVSATQITAAITAADIAIAGTIPVTVFNAPPGGGTSNAVSFTINNPVPTLTTLSPTSATAGGTAFTLTVNGTNFVSSSVVRWNGNDRATTFVSATQLTAAITAADIVTAGTVPVTVFNPAPGGGTSNAVNFTVNNRVPTLSTLSPTSAIAGGTAFTLTVNGTYFVSNSVVRWNGNARTTTFVSATQLTAAITAADIATAGTIPVTVFNPAPGGGASNAVNFPVNNPVPTLATLNPTSATAGGSAFTLTVNGTNFVSSSVVRWNGTAKTTTYISATQLTAAITAADIASTGTIPVTVFNPTPGGGTSGVVNFTVAPNPVYTLTINKIGNGTVTKAPDQATYHNGDVVTLTATPDAGWLLDHWSANVVAGKVTIDGNTTVTATFTQIEYALTIIKVGNGTVTSDKTAPYHLNDVVTLTAAADQGWTFSAWSGACSGAGTCAVTMDGAKSVTATFVVNTHSDTYDDMDPAWTYTGDWGSMGSVGSYADTVHYSLTTGNETQVVVNGQQVELIYLASPISGSVDVYIDNAKVATINQYCDYWYMQKTWMSDLLTAGAHTVRIAHASGGFTTVDAVMQIAAPVILSTGLYDDADPAISYAGRWFSLAGSTEPYANTLRYSTTVGAETQVNFTGQQIKLIYLASPISGMVDVYLDGVKVTSINQYSVYWEWQKVWTSDLLPAGNHSLRVVHASGSFASFDALTVVTNPAALTTGVYDDANAAIGYEGIWYNLNGTTEPYNNSLRYTTRFGNDAQVNFNGRQVKLTYLASPYSGMVDVYVDGVKVASIDQYSASWEWQRTWTSNLLADGNHSLRIVYASGGGIASIDAITVVTTPVILSNGVYDDANTAFSYEGRWQTMNGVSGPYADTLHYSNELGTAAQVAFNGRHIQLSFLKAPTSGKVDVYIDGVKVTTIDQVSANWDWQQTWTSDVLSAGDHSLRIVYVSSGSFGNIDAITVSP